MTPEIEAVAKRTSNELRCDADADGECHRSDADADGEFLVTEAAMTPEIEAAAKRISNELRETNMDLLIKVVSNFGVEASLTTLADAHVCIANGGMFVADGSRKR